jgi:lipoprotein-anchoring transpeptidase ErfK/SrfK
MPDNLDERLVAAAARLEQGAAVRSPVGVRARGDQRRRRHTATMAVVPVAVLAIAGTLGLTFRPSGGSSRQDVTGAPSASSIQTSAEAPTSSVAAKAAPAATVDLVHDVMTVVDARGNLVRSLKITAGGPAHPTRSGTFTVVDKKPSISFSSAKVGFTDANDYYDLNVAFFIDLGPNAPAIYAMPWQQSSLGKANVSHGDIGIGTDDASWLYSRLVVGDTIQIGDAAR